MIFKKLIFLCSVTFFPLSSCFNIETSSDQLSYLQSPTLLVGYERVPGQPRVPVPYFPDITPSFFGYDFSIKSGESVNTFNVFTGAPKTADASELSSQIESASDSADKPATPFVVNHINNNFAKSATGNIYSCLYPSTLPSCNSVVPTPSAPGDSFGLSVGLGGNGDLHACSPTKTQNCPPAAYSPGYCYRRNDSVWNPDAQTGANACPNVNLDLIFVLDGSSSVGADSFDLVKNWVVNVSKTFHISDGSTQIGVIQYSHVYLKEALENQKYLVTEVPLGKYRNHEDFTNAVEKIELHAYTTFTAHALNKTILDFENSTRFNDTGTSKILILVTDGMSTDSEHLNESAKYVRSLGITTFAVGVGEARIQELKIIATGKESDENIFYVSDFDGLSDIINELRKAILSFTLEGATARNGTISYGLEFSEYGFSMDSGRNPKVKQAQYNHLQDC